VRLRRGAERRRAGFIFPAFLSHIPTMPPMLWPLSRENDHGLGTHKDHFDWRVGLGGRHRERSAAKGASAWPSFGRSHSGRAASRRSAGGLGHQRGAGILLHSPATRKSGRPKAEPRRTRKLLWGAHRAALRRR
jgi:hypothetical protein